MLAWVDVLDQQELCRESGKTEDCRPVRRRRIGANFLYHSKTPPYVPACEAVYPPTCSPPFPRPLPQHGWPPLDHALGALPATPPSLGTLHRDRYMTKKVEHVKELLLLGVQRVCLSERRGSCKRGSRKLLHTSVLVSNCRFHQARIVVLP